MQRARRALDPAEVALLSQRAAENLQALPEFVTAQLVLCYVSVRAELPTEPLLHALLDSGRALAVPRVDGPGLRACLLEDVSDLAEGAFGIPTSAGADVSELVDLCITPGLAFTESGARLGYGGGYYDRFFASHPRVLRIGYCFEEQLVDELPTEPHDGTMAMIVTPERVIRVQRR